MFRKSRIQSKIKRLIKQIEAIERKRSRSQAALVEAILTQTTPKDEDVDYFNMYTEQINNIRNLVSDLKAELKK